MTLRRAINLVLLAASAGGLLTGIAVRLSGQPEWAAWIWVFGSAPMLLAVLVGIGRAVAALLASFEKRRRPKFGTRATALHDPSGLAYLLDPTLFQGREVNVAVETQSPLTIGMTVVDWWGVTGRPPNVRFMNTVDADGFYDLFTERLRRLP